MNRNRYIIIMNDISHALSVTVTFRKYIQNHMSNSCYFETTRPWIFSATPWFVELESRSLRYQGRHALTKEGVVCQRWDTQKPHSHNLRDLSRFPDATVEEAGNNCRRSHKSWPWCFTTSNRRWDFCGKLELLCREWRSYIKSPNRRYKDTLHAFANYRV